MNPFLDELLAAAIQLHTDVHTAAASKMYDVLPVDVTPEMRRAAKSMNFIAVYGGVRRPLK